MKRQLGKSTLAIEPFVLGGNVFGWTIDEQASFSVLDAFTGAGFEMIDTADVYSSWKQGNKGGESESIIGEWMKKRKNRNSVLIATKVGGDMGEGKTLRKEYILKAADASLKRLQTDHIDLYQSHWDDETVPVEETLEAYSKLISEGKVRYIGASNYSKERLLEAMNASKRDGLPRYDTFQPRYNLYDRAEFEKAYRALCLENEIGVISYYGLASGFLTGKYQSENDLSISARGNGVQKYFTSRGFEIIKALKNVADKYQVPPATIAIAWLMQAPGITAPISSATSPQQLKELIRANEILLDAESIDQLNKASDQ